MLNKLFGVLLAIGVIVVGVKACDPDFSKTKQVLVSVPRLAPMPTCVQICLRDDPTDECVRACVAAHPPKSAAREEFQRRVQAAQAAAIVIDDKPLTKEDTLATVTLKFKPCPPPTTIKQINKAPTVNAAKAKRTVAVKKHYSKKTFSKTKAHDFKFTVSHHHKSKPHHHHHHHGGGGHHHSGPQKISAHGPPTHLTGCGP